MELQPDAVYCLLILVAAESKTGLSLGQNDATAAALPNCW